MVAVLCISLFVGIAFTGLMININVSRWSEPRQAIAEMREQLPPDAVLASFSPIDHRFAYYYETPIAEFDWPRDVADLPPGVEYFCFMWHDGDTAESRAAGRGRTWTTTPGTLPFAWTEVTTLCVERRVKPTAARVVVGKVERPLRAEVSDVTAPQRSARSREQSAVR